MNTLLSARDPRWSDLAHTSIVLSVVFEETKDIYGEIPFAASAYDSEPHGVDLFNRAVAGEFGEVLEPTEQMILAQVMCQRGVYSASATARINELAAELDTLQDAVVMKLATEEQLHSLPSIQAELNAFRLYRVQLAQLETLAGYPAKFDWPLAPAKPFVYEPVEELAPVQGVSDDELPKI
ncbi:phage tail protein [Pseudomonas alliivorans]|uniref:phage tail protein n=1 Tax=Pseudomonas alliivorans TaxID=2810613 RepID=UPI001AEB195C|nr:phage tail protein [Pseudomonas alliivorans]MBP0942081.1 phage tail protein [Pseudomonas alliivorans]MEE4879322.1 phage tail protein [Pseudomonas alliivorans]MEE4931594.1 phage tail protein [Pseudomonas alliivorans]MEE4937371.1 phage tail protein [Pseudomonas alliivorans]MEE4942006.1 phage tail protein [Pseudomonas alliivorans]